MSKIKQIKVHRLAQGNFLLLENAKLVFQYAVNSVSSFYEVYQKIRKGSQGSTTHQEQDLLRAMLVFACSGLDAVVKQLINDTLSDVINKDSSGKGAREQFKKFIEKRIRKANASDSDDKNALFDSNFIAQILTNPDPREALLKSLQEYLCASSLQSRDQLLEVAKHFELTKEMVLEDFDLTKIAFDTRNDIIHEMDVVLKNVSSRGKKKRKVRGAPDMVKYTENILNIAACFINSVANKIYGQSKTTRKG